MRRSLVAALLLAAAFAPARAEEPAALRAQPARAVPIWNGDNRGLAQSYFGAGSYDLPALWRLEGKFRLDTWTRGWEIGSSGLVVSANADPRSPGGGQGMYYDPHYRTAYEGQDGSATSFWISGITPLATDVAVRAFATATVSNRAGRPQTVYQALLATPLEAGQVARIRPQMRVETNNGFFGYVIPEGLDVPPVDPEGRFVTVDCWTRGAPRDRRGPSAPGATADCPQPSDFGQAGTDPPLPRYTVSIDVLHLIETGYHGIRTEDADLVHDGYAGGEWTIVNNRRTPPVWNDADPLAEAGQLFLGGALVGATADNGTGSGAANFALFGAAGLKRTVVCGNRATAATGPTDCILVAGADRGLHSTQTGGYLIVAQPGGTGPNTVLLDPVGGNLTVTGAIHGASTVSDGAVLKPGFVHLDDPAAGQTYAVPDNKAGVILTWTTPPTALTVMLPPNPGDGQEFTVISDDLARFSLVAPPPGRGGPPPQIRHPPARLTMPGLKYCFLLGTWMRCPS